jgi:hypothetical protein
MSKLSEIISRRRSSGQSRTGALFGSLKDKVKETIDPRQIFNQTGILTALFPSLKAYKADSKPQKFNNTGSPSWLDVKPKNVQVENIEKNTEIFAKNSMYFPEIARDINVSRINVSKLVKLVSPAAAEKADMYYKKTSEMEKSYESKFKSESKKSTRVDNKSKKSSFSWIKMIGLIGTVGVSYLLLDFIKNKEDSVVKEIYDDLNEKFDSLKNNFLDYKEKNFTDLDTEIKQLFGNKESKPLFSKLEEQTDKIIGSFSKDFSLMSIKEYLFDGTGPLKKYETAVSSFKDTLGQSITNVFPAAAASTLPTITPKSEGVTGTPSLGRSTRPERSTSGGFNLNEAIGGAESGGNYDITFGDRVNSSGVIYNTVKVGGKGETLKTAEQFSGKKLTDMTLSEVQQFQAYRQSVSANSGGLGKYGFMPSTLFGDRQGGGLVGGLGLSMNTKFTPEVQERLNDLLQKQNREVMRRSGVPDTRGYVYMGHYLGPAGAAEIYQATLRGDGNMTVAELWNRKFGYLSGKNKIDVGKNNVELTQIKAKDFEAILDKRLEDKYQQSLRGQRVTPSIGQPISFGDTTDKLSRVAVMKNANRGKEVLIVNRETVSIQNQTQVASNVNTEDKNLNSLIEYATGPATV